MSAALKHVLLPPSLRAAGAGTAGLSAVREVPADFPFQEPLRECKSLVTSATHPPRRPGLQLRTDGWRRSEWHTFRSER